MNESLNKEQKQKNFFKSIYLSSLRSKVERSFGGDKYKAVVLNLPIEAIEEIKEWSNEEN